MVDKAPRRDFGAEFEEEVRTFLEEKLGFADVKGGPDFHIAPEGKANQIDACGRWGDILFIFECKASGRKTKKNLRDDILSTDTRARIAIENYRSTPEYTRCTYVKFIFITKKIEIPETEKELFKHTRLWYADEDLLEYYSDLYEKIGDYATYNFLADFGIHPPPTQRLEVHAMLSQLGPYRVYSFFVNPKELLKFSYVARRRSLKENFYQRMLDKGRIKKIQNFIDQGGVFPTNIIISLRDGDRSFSEGSNGAGSNTGVLTIGGSYSACWIVDGQHRLYAFAKSHSSVPVPCIAFDSISIEDERRFFLEINREQKPIQPDLIWDLEGLANPDSYRGVISNVVRTLNNREPFLGKIYIPVKGSRAEKVVNMAAFCNGIANASLAKRITPNCIGMQNPLFTEVTRTVTNRIASVIERFFLSLETSLVPEHKDFVFGNAGIPVMLYLLEPIAAYVGRIPSFSDLTPFTQGISDFLANHYLTHDDVKRLKSELNSEGARKVLAKQIGLHIRTTLKVRDFWPKMEQNELVAEIIEMERRIANLIATRLSKITVSWEKQRVPQAIYQIARRRMDQDGTRFEDNLGLGDELQILLQEDNWKEFGPLLLQKDGFVNQDEVKLAFGYLGKIRNPVSHGKTVIPTKDELNQCELYLQKLSRVAQEVVPEYPEETLPDEDLAP